LVNLVDRPFVTVFGAVLSRRGVSYIALPRTATWRSGYAADCKSAYPSSILGVASSRHLLRRFGFVPCVQPCTFGQNEAPE
jgi:hypothetical protein